MTTITRDDIARAIDRLTGAFGQPFATTAKDAARMVDAWFDTLSDCNQVDLARAVTDLMRERSRWPAASDVRTKCMSYEQLRTKSRRLDEQRHEGNGEFCLRCHARDLIQRPNGRFMPFHAENCPGLHEVDRLDQRHAIASGASTWRNGKPPQAAQRELTTAND